MKSRVIISSYPITVIIGNYRWHPGVNELPESEWAKVHWPAVACDRRLSEPAVGAAVPVTVAAPLDAAPVR